MKKVTAIIICLLLVLHYNTKSQIIKNNFKTDEINRKAKKRHKHHTVKTDTVAKFKTMLESYDEEEGNDNAPQTDTTPDWTGNIFATGTVTSIEDLSNPNANISVGGILNYSGNSFAFAFNPKSASSSDSANLIKTFLFPEINSRAFVIEYDRAILNTDGISGNLFLNLSTSFIKDTAGHLITPYNVLTGLRFSIYKDLSKSSEPNVQNLKSMEFSLTPYYSMITIDPKDFGNYEQVFNKAISNKYLPPTIQALGGKFSLEINCVEIFFDYKYIINGSSNYIINNSYWTIGTSVNAQLFSF